MARRSAKPLSEVHSEAYLAAIRQIVSFAQAKRSETVFAAVVNAEIGEEIFTREVVRALRKFGLPDGRAKTDEPLRNYLHYLEPFLPYSEDELKAIARGEMPDLSRLGKHKSLSQLHCKPIYGEVSSGYISEGAMESTDQGDKLSYREAKRLESLLEESMAYYPKEYAYLPGKLAVALGCPEHSFNRHALDSAMNGDVSQLYQQGDWEALATICLQVEHWIGNRAIVVTTGATYQGRVDELKKKLANGSPQPV